jgi:hypothetical protein
VTHKAPKTTSTAGGYRELIQVALQFLGAGAFIFILGWLIAPDQHAGTFLEGAIDSSGWVMDFTGSGRSATSTLRLAAFLTQNGRSENFLWPVGLALPHAGDRVRAWVDPAVQGHSAVLNQLEINGKVLRSTPGWSTKLSVRRHWTFILAGVASLLGFGMLLYAGVLWLRHERELRSA